MVIYLSIGVLVGLWFTIMQIVKRPEHSKWYMLLLIFLNNAILYPITVPVHIYRHFYGKNKTCKIKKYPLRDDKDIHPGW